MTRPDYEPRMQRLRESAGARTVEAHARAMRAINALRSRGLPVNFNTVAREGNVSKDFLYGHEELAAQIRDLRAQMTPTVSIPPRERPSAASAERQLTVLRQANEQLRQENAELKEANAALRGEVLRLRSQRG